MRNIILSVIAAMSAMLAVSCQKGDGEADYGNSLIYIPQATVSAGIDNYYNVPSGGAENTLNFGTTETDVDIYLGVMLSGKKAGSGFSVNIVEDSEAYEVEFEYRNGEIGGLICSCFCSYNCKHEFAAMLQLEETLALIEKNYADEYARTGYFAAVNKGTLFAFAIDGKDNGSFTL